MYTFKTIVRLHDTDAAGVLFFGNYFKLAHDAYESFMISIGFGFREMFEQKDYLLLIVHAEGDYKKPLRTGDELTIELKTEELGKSSYTLGYRLLDSAGNEVCSVRTVHVAVNKLTEKATRLPEGLREKLETIR